MGSVNAQITDAKDDYNVRRSSGSFSDGNNNLDMGQLASASNDIGHTFSSVAIPQEAKITAAKIEFVSFASDAGGTVTVEFSANDVDDAVAPTSTVEFDALVKTTARVGWTLPDFGVGGTLHDSPDISTIIQELVDRSGWASGQAITILVFDDGSTNNKRSSRSFNRSPQGQFSARLIVRFGSPGEIWIESEALHFTDANALERFVLGSQDDHASSESISTWLGI